MVVVCVVVVCVVVVCGGSCICGSGGIYIYIYIYIFISRCHGNVRLNDDSKCHRIIPKLGA